MSVATRPALWQGPLFQLNTTINWVEHIESTHPTDPPRAVRRTHTGLSWSGVVSAAGLLEAVINTVVMDIHAGTPASSRYDFDAEALDRRIRDTRGSLDADGGFTYLETLEKYSRLLEYIAARPFDRGRDPFQRADTVITFRNYLIHPTAQFRQTTATGDAVPRAQRRIEGRLQGHAQENPYGDGVPFRFYGHAYLRWVATSTINFIDEFYDRIETEPVYEPFIQQLSLAEMRG